MRKYRHWWSLSGQFELVALNVEQVYGRELFDSLIRFPCAGAFGLAPASHKK
jgi:hypothetical protein